MKIYLVKPQLFIKYSIQSLNNTTFTYDFIVLKQLSSKCYSLKKATVFIVNIQHIHVWTGVSFLAYFSYFQILSKYWQVLLASASFSPQAALVSTMLPGFINDSKQEHFCTYFLYSGLNIGCLKNRVICKEVKGSSEDKISSQI